MCSLPTKKETGTRGCVINIARLARVASGAQGGRLGFRVGRRRNLRRTHTGELAFFGGYHRHAASFWFLDVLVPARLDLLAATTMTAHRPSAIGSRQSAIGHRHSALGNRQSAIGHRHSAIGTRPSALGTRQSRVGVDFLGIRRSQER